MRIACLLPSATDICIALGLADHIVGVTHECDISSVYKGQSHSSSNPTTTNNPNDDDNPPPSGTVTSDSGDKDILILTKSGIDDNTMKSQSDIDALVKQTAAKCTLDTTPPSLYPILTEELKRARPSIVITQDLCRACAPSPREVHSILSEISSSGDSDVRVYSLQPQSLMEVADSFLAIANLCGVPERGIALRDFFVSQLKVIRQTVQPVDSDGPARPRPSVLVLEWLDPPYDGGHWIPDMIREAGCDVATVRLPSSSTSVKSQQVTWQQIHAADPDMVLISCCGFDLGRNKADALSSPFLSSLRAVRENNVFATDGNLYFARPGPSLLGGVAIVAVCAAACTSGDGDEYGESVRRVWNELQEGGVDVPKEYVGWERITIPYETKQSQAFPSKSKTTGNMPVCDMEDIMTPNNNNNNNNNNNKDGNFHSLHENACAKGDMVYTDPISGYQVFTKLAHVKRGKCCGSGCRHCPYHHQNVKEEDRIYKISQPAFLFHGGTNDNNNDDHDNFSMSVQNIRDQKRNVKIVFFSGGKDSFLAIRALIQQHRVQAQQTTNNNTPPPALLLLTTFDATTRIVAHQEIHIETILQQAKHLALPLLGVPMHRASDESYVDRMKLALENVAAQIGGTDQIVSLVFGDLHLEHIRQWRDDQLYSVLSDEGKGYGLEYPLWKVPYRSLMTDLEQSGVECVLSSSTREGANVDDVFDAEFSKRMVACGMDGFGENGEFHTVAKVWTVSRERALGLY